MKLTIQLAALLAIVILPASAQTLTSFDGGTADGTTATFAAPVPEPASWVIAGVALFLVSVIVQRRGRKERR